MPSFLRLVCRRNMTAAHYKGGHHPGNDLGLHYTALPPILASCPYSDQLLVTRKFWSPGANRSRQLRRDETWFPKDGGERASKLWWLVTDGKNVFLRNEDGFL